MKKVFLTCLLFIMLSVSAQAQTLNHAKLFAEIMPISDILRFPKETKKSFEVHLLDSYEQFPALAEIKNKNLEQFNLIKKVRGNMKYVKNFPMPYAYDVTNSGQIYTHEVKIYFLNANQKDKQHFTQRLAEAEQIWNSQKISTDFIYNFKFTLTENIRDAHYRVLVMNSTRGPYNVRWARDWSADVVAHELGHMLGIADEYETLTSEQHCLRHSLMCASHSGQLMKHHYYFVLRRLVN